MSRAFFEDPMMTYVFPEPLKRTISLARLMRTVVNYCYLYGKVFTNDNLEGIACWLIPEKTSFTCARKIGSGMILDPLRIGHSNQQRLNKFIKLTDRMERECIQQPHWYLWYLGVEPTKQRHGIGASLLKSMINQIDQDGSPCYLETANYRDIAYYEKFNFRIVGQKRIPNTFFDITAMIRSLER